jgi:hypothetical protein
MSYKEEFYNKVGKFNVEDLRSFLEEADQRDEKLGLTELRSKLDKEYIQYTIINNH